MIDVKEKEAKASFFIVQILCIIRLSNHQYEIRRRSGT